MQRPFPRLARSRAGGFTLLELLIAITIIAILASLLVVAVNGGMRTARIAQCRTEISGLDAALNEFKAKYGEYPPSRITLYHNASAWNTVDSNAARERERQRSRMYMRKFWPQFNFSNTSAYPWTATVELRGAECLVFFLGGVSRSNTAANDLIGFSNNPAAPFDRSATSRTGPFFEFNQSRLRTSYTVGGYPFQCYLDTLPGQDHPYLYVSSNEGAGYDYDVTDAVCYDVTSTDHGSRTNAPIAASNQPNRLTSRPYQTYGATSNAVGYLNGKSFQIISPGSDHDYGEGGPWSDEQGDALLTGTRNGERDNITNFHNTVLAPN